MGSKGGTRPWHPFRFVTGHGSAIKDRYMKRKTDTTKLGSMFNLNMLTIMDGSHYQKSKMDPLYDICILLVDCPPGYYIDNIDNTDGNECKECAIDTYNNDTDVVQCPSCAGGQTTNGKTGQLACGKCGRSKYPCQLKCNLWWQCPSFLLFRSFLAWSIWLFLKKSSAYFVAD